MTFERCSPEDVEQRCISTTLVYRGFELDSRQYSVVRNLAEGIRPEKRGALRKTASGQVDPLLELTGRHRAGLDWRHGSLDESVLARRRDGSWRGTVRVMGFGSDIASKRANSCG